MTAGQTDDFFPPPFSLPRFSKPHKHTLLARNTIPSVCVSLPGPGEFDVKFTSSASCCRCAHTKLNGWMDAEKRSEQSQCSSVCDSRQFITLLQQLDSHRRALQNASPVYHHRMCFFLSAITGQVIDMSGGHHLSGSWRSLADGRA